MRQARKQEGYEGRYDHEPDLQRKLAAVYELRTACQQTGHAKGPLDFNHGTNVMTCGNCGEIMDLNELVHPALRVPRQVA